MPKLNARDKVPVMKSPLPDAPPEYFNFATDVVDRWAEDETKLALHWVDAQCREERKLTFAEIAARSRSLAGAMQEEGLKPGDRVGIVIGREPDWWIGMIALIRAGLVAVPGTTLLTPKDFKYRIEAARIDALMVDEANAKKVDEIRAECPRLKAFWSNGPEREGWNSLEAAYAGKAQFEGPRTRGTDLSLAYFTSGTTGPPKLVLHTQVSYGLGHVVTGRVWLDLGPDDLHWNLSDTGWAKAAWSSLYAPWSQGAAVFVQAPGPKFNAAETLEVLQRYPITTFCAPPTVFRQLVTLDLKAKPLNKLRHAVAAGEPLNPEVISVWKDATGITVRDGYGQTETTILAGNFPGKEVKPGSMGLAAPGYQIEVLDENLNELPAGQEGDIAIRVKPKRPIGLFVEYEDNPEENAAKFQGDYYLTGDRAYRDEDGYLWFVCRSDDVILSAGYRIGPFEVESALVEHEAVLEAAVVGVPDADRYEIVKAFIILNEGYEASDDLAHEIQNYVKRVTAPYKYPRRIDFVTTLPKTISGKIRRIELRESEKSEP